MIAGSTAAMADPAIVLTSPGSEYSGAQFTLGFEFSVSSGQMLTALGAYDSGADGLAGAADVGLWDTSGNLLASAVVPAGTGGTLDGLFRFTSIAPFALVGGTHYVVGAFEPSDNASSLGTGQGGTGSINPLVTIYEDRFSNFNSAFSYADTSDGNLGGAWLGGNFELGGGSVPEPASWALMLIGFGGLGAALRRRRATVGPAVA